MLLVDSRAGSDELAPGLQALGLKTELTTLEFGDVAFEGRGIAGDPLWIGIEFKQLTELAEAIKGRLPGHQLPGLVQNFERRYLLIEGEWATDAQGRLLHRSRMGTMKPILGMPPAAELRKRLLTYAVRGGLQYLEASRRKYSLEWIHALYRFWTDVDLDKHRSHLMHYDADLDRMLYERASLVKKVAAKLPGIGWGKAGNVAEHFATVREMVEAEVKDWEAIDGIGNKLARSAVQALRNPA